MWFSELCFYKAKKQRWPELKKGVVPEYIQTLRLFSQAPFSGPAFVGVFTNKPIYILNLFPL
jgi:hypothetical protein